MKKVARVLLCVTFWSMLVCGVNAQNAAKNWFFGQGARINFNGGTPTPSFVNTIITNEGSSSISDSNGNLLFYTSGVTVWDKNNSVMPNGFGLMGSSSSTHSALIVPCNCNKYFIFTTDAAEGRYFRGLRYSVVDMSANNGLGDVISKNNLLLAPAAEKIAGISDGNGGFWVVGHSMGNNWFYSFHILASSDCTLDPQSQVTTKISAVGSIYLGGHANFGQGQMKISPDGTRLAVAGMNFGPGSFV